MRHTLKTADQYSFKFFLVLVLLFLLSIISCNETSTTLLNTTDSAVLKTELAGIKIERAKKLLQDGQLITRSDNDFESKILQNFSRRERVYSHSGIVFKEKDIYMVYHCMGGEENPSGACKKEPFDSFVNPLQKTGFGIFQYQLERNELNSLHQVLENYYQQKIPFDASFNLKTRDSLYCSEMISSALNKATGGRLIIPLSHIDNFKPKIMGYKYNTLFFKRFDFIGIDDLYLNSFCKEIIRVNYN